MWSDTSVHPAKDPKWNFPSPSPSPTPPQRLSACHLGTLHGSDASETLSSMDRTMFSVSLCNCFSLTGVLEETSHLFFFFYKAS